MSVRYTFQAVWCDLPVIAYRVQLRPDLEKIERSLRQGGRLGQHVEGVLAHADSIVREGRQIGQQAPEAVDRHPIGGVLGRQRFSAFRGTTGADRMPSSVTKLEHSAVNRRVVGSSPT